MEMMKQKMENENFRPIGETQLESRCRELVAEYPDDDDSGARVAIHSGGGFTVFGNASDEP